MHKAMLCGVLVSLLVLSGCGRFGQGAVNGEISDDEVEALGEAVGDEATVAAGALTVAGALSLAQLTASTPACVSEEGGTYTFDCEGVSYRGGTASISGRVTIERLPEDQGFTLTAQDLRVTAKGAYGVRSYEVVRNGTRTVRRTAGGVRAENDLTIRRDYRGRFGNRVATVRNTLTLEFTPEAGASVSFDEPLPSGALEVFGEVRWDDTRRTFSLTVETTEMLRYDATCDVNPIVDGELQARFGGTGPRPDGVLRIAFSACGQPPTATLTRAF